MTTIERALRLACARIADSPQNYEEAKSADDWYEEFIRHAEAEDATEVSGVAYRLHGDALMEKWTPPDGAKQISGTISGIANRAGHEPPSGMHDPREGV